MRRAWARVRAARKQASGLRLRFLLAIADRKLPTLTAVQRLRALTGAPAAEIRSLLAEVGPTSSLVRHLEECERLYRAEMESPYATGSYGPHSRFLYALVRILRPEVVVETGVSSGGLSAYILAALERSARGRLVSIDLPFWGEPGLDLRPVVPGTSIELWAASPLPPGREPGWMISDDLRHRWDLRLGDAREFLPGVLEELGPVDLFFHDSLHTRDHMLFEFETVWPYLVRGGVLVSDDVFRRHDALPAFAASAGVPFTTWSGLGLMRKRDGGAVASTARASAPPYDRARSG